MIFQRVQKERAETCPGRPEIGQKIAFQQTLEEALRQILSILRRIPSPSDISIERVPIPATQLLQCRLGRGTGTLPRRQDNAPVCRREFLGRALGGPCIPVAW